VSATDQKPEFFSSGDDEKASESRKFRNTEVGEEILSQESVNYSLSAIYFANKFLLQHALSFYILSSWFYTTTMEVSISNRDHI